MRTALSVQGVALLLLAALATTADAAPLVEPPRLEPAWRWSAGWGVIGAGFVAALCGGTFLGQSPEIRDDASRAGNPALRHDLLERGDDFQTTGAILLGVGGGVIIAGVVILALPNKPTGRLAAVAHRLVVRW